jgi:hypothetical protein
MLREALEEDGYTVEDGRAARRHRARQAGRVDLVVSDV